jgi:hypothetical protein
LEPGGCPPGHVTIVTGNGYLTADTVATTGEPPTPGVKRNTYAELLVNHPHGPSGVYLLIPIKPGT